MNEQKLIEWLNERLEERFCQYDEIKKYSYDTKYVDGQIDSFQEVLDYLEENKDEKES